MRVYKTTDLIEVKIDNMSVFISPLSYHQKMEISESFIKAEGDMVEAMKVVAKAISFSMKDIKGVTNEDGTDYKLQFANNELTSECIDDLLNLPIHQKLITVCQSLLHGVSGQILGPDGQPLEGVSVIPPKMESKSRKK